MTKVALQATKRRKMVFDVDFLDDSGVPMDGIELDSSSPNVISQSGSLSGQAASRSVNLLSANTTTSGNIISPTSIRGNVNLISSNSQQPDDGSLVGSTNGNLKLIANNHISSATSPVSSAPDSQQLHQQHIQAPINSDLPADLEHNLATNMTNNEAMTNDDPSMLLYGTDDSDLKSCNEDSPDFSHSPNYPMNDDSCLANEDDQQHCSEATVSNFADRTTNEAKRSKEKSNKIRSFGELFDDDDLD